MSKIVIEFAFGDGAYAELCGNTIKFWQNYGPPEFEGAVKEFKLQYPKYYKILAKHHIIKVH